MNLRYPEYWIKEYPGARAWLFAEANGSTFMVKKGDVPPRVLVRFLGVIE